MAPSHMYICVCVVLLTLAPFVSCACTLINSCKCKMDNGDIIDLTPLAKDDQTAKFPDVPDTAGNDLFSWNPCKSFTEGDCADVAVCQIQPALPPAYFSLGTQASAKFIVDDQGRNAIEYSADSVPGENTPRTAYVALTCTTGTEDTLLVDGERPTIGVYDLELQSPHACPKSGGSTPGTPGGSSGGLSAGSVMVIIFFVVLVVFLMVGIPIQIFARKQSGRRVIPGSDYIFAIPGHIKDGALFVVKRGQHTPKYDNI